MKGLAWATSLVGATLSGVGVYYATRASKRVMSGTVGSIGGSSSSASGTTSSGASSSSRTSGHSTGSSSPGPSGPRPPQATEIPISASPEQRYQALKTMEPRDMPGLTAAQVGQIQTILKRHGTAINGVTAGGAVRLDLKAPHAAQVSLLATGASIVIPGRTESRVAYLERLARKGQIIGLSPSGQPIY